MSEVTKPIALDESFNTTGQTPKNIADVIKNGLQEVAQAIDSHQGGGGHVILDQNGNALDQEPNMQFVDAHTSDDSVNAKTIIENIKSVASADYPSETEDGLYLIPDGDGSVIEPASEDYVEVTADGVKTLTQLFVELIKKSDTSKLNGNSYIKQPNGDLLYYQYPICFSRCRTSNADSSIVSLIYQGSNTAILYYSIITSSGTTINNGDSTPTNGAKLTLYYGNKKAVVDLQTTANRCLMSDGTTTVSDALTYSTTAKKIGTFLGRNLYRKVFEYTEVNVPINTDVKLTGSVGIVPSKIVRMSTVLRQSGRSAITNSPVLQTYITDSNEMWINQGMSSSYNSATITVIVEYTD